MKISCQTCHAKYTVADEKIVGRIAKIKCKKCGSTIVVNGNDPSLLAAPSAHDPSRQGEGDEEGETRVVGESASNGQSYDPGGGEEWTVNLSDDDQPVMTTAQLVQAVRDGRVPPDTFVWRDGMSDWSAVTDVAELASKLGGAAPAPAGYASEDDEGLNGTMMMNESAPVPAAHASSPFGAGAASRQDAASAARRQGGRAGSVDLFGAQQAAEAAPPPSPFAPSGGTGERNENSVLFSLSALTATEGAAKALKSRAEDSLLDLRPATRPSSSSHNSSRAALDDIMNLSGGGIAAAPVLAPPPLLAPVIEPPPASMPSHPPMGQPAMSAYMMQAPPQQKGKGGLIIGIVAGLALAAGAAFFLLQPSGTETPTVVAAEAAKPTAEAPKVEAPAAEPTLAAAVPGEPVAAAEKTAEPEAATEKVAATEKAAAPTPATPKTTTGAAEKTPTPAATPTPTAAPEAAPAAAGREFSRGAATSALSSAAGSARSCRKDDGPTGAGRVKVTFAPSGNVTSAQVQGPPFAGTSVGGCVAGVFRGARVPAFDGSPVTVTKSFSIN